MILLGFHSSLFPIILFFSYFTFDFGERNFNLFTAFIILNFIVIFSLSFTILTIPLVLWSGLFFLSIHKIVWIVGAFHPPLLILLLIIITGRETKFSMFCLGQPA